MKVGITATRNGLTETQQTALKQHLEALQPIQLHHGDCRGGDADAHEIARKLGLYVVGHPPSNPSQRALCDFDAACSPLPYLERNHAIVDDTDLLIALPATSNEELRSGTWATIRYARKVGKPITIIPGDL